LGQTLHNALTQQQLHQPEGENKQTNKQKQTKVDRNCKEMQHKCLPQQKNKTKTKKHEKFTTLHNYATYGEKMDENDCVSSVHALNQSCGCTFLEIAT
jgi:hypothetical protein